MKTLMRISILILIGLAPRALALPFAEGRVSGGYAYLPGRDGGKAVSTAMISGTGRFAYQLDNSNYFLALDVTAYRVFKASALGSNNEGNTVLLSAGHSWSFFTLWLGGGAGELRSYDRPEEKSRPYRYYVTDAQLGMTFNLYQSDSARVQLGFTLGHQSPDPEWRERYGLSSIESAQFDIGFKLLNW